MSEPGLVSAIVPTIGRVESLAQLLDSLIAQSHRPDEVIVADGSDGPEISRLVAEDRWARAGLNVRSVQIQPPNAVRQRRAAISLARGEFLLLLDDDVVPEPGCLAAMLALLRTRADVVAITADFNNQSWSAPTTLWRWYLRWCCGLVEGQWQGRVVGPLLRFGYNPSPEQPMPMEWLGAGNSLVRRAAYDAAGGFSEFFLHRCTINEDVDLGIKLRRQGGILLAPEARMAHLHAPGGRVTVSEAAEDDVYNRYQVLHKTRGLARWRAGGLAALYVSLESASNILGGVLRFRFNDIFPRILGRARGLWHILRDDSR